MATKFEEDVTKAVDEGLFAGVGAIAVDKTGKYDLCRISRLRAVQVEYHLPWSSPGPGKTDNWLGRRIYEKALGTTSIGEGGKPFQLDSTMWLASCTKVGF